MRIETDVFYDPENENYSVGAYIEDDSIIVSVKEIFESGVSRLTRQQAREFAKQILEMCGDGGDE